MRILVIPAIPNTPLRLRAIELAAALGRRGHRTHVLVGERQPPGLGRMRKLLWHLRMLVTVSSKRHGQGVRLWRLPSAPRAPALTRHLHRIGVRALAAACGIDVVITQAIEDIPAPRAKHRAVVYDLLDHHEAGASLAGQPDVARQVRRVLEREIGAADAVLASSGVLRNLAASRYGREAILVPNGVWCAPFRQVSRAEVARVRTSLGLEGGPVLGFVGGVDDWVDASLVLTAADRLRARHPKLTILVVGEGSRANEFRSGGAIVTGFVAPDAVPPFAALMDVGLVPFRLDDATHAMLPLKVFDHAASRRLVVSTPLHAYDGLELPFVIQAAPEPGAFAEAMARALDTAWHPDWDQVVDAFDWDRIGTRLDGLIRELGPAR
jgi:glycosyltransferase involved in cell wall biosynthesis